MISKISKSYGEYNAMTVSAGSGGGSVDATGSDGLYCGGAGGGYIYLQAQRFSNSGSLLARGGAAAPATDCGGGSGGTIFVSTYYNQGTGTLDVAGGSAALVTAEAL
jgi:hypothetical protein